jgi:hypothetical protein
MGYKGWFTFGDTELANTSRTAQLAAAMGIDYVRTNPASVQWIEDALDPDPAAVLAGDGRDDGETESQPARFLGVGLVLVEHGAAAVLRDARAIVADETLGGAASALDLMLGGGQ